MPACLTGGPSLTKSPSASITAPLTPPLLPEILLFSPPLPPSGSPAPLPPPLEEKASFLGSSLALFRVLPRNQLSHWWKLRLTEVRWLPKVTLIITQCQHQSQVWPRKPTFLYLPTATPSAPSVPSVFQTRSEVFIRSIWHLSWDKTQWILNIVI